MYATKNKHKLCFVLTVTSSDTILQIPVWLINYGICVLNDY